MKIFQWTAILLCASVLCWSCNKGENTEVPAVTNEDVNGVWQLKSWTGEANNPDGTSYTFDDVVYVYVVLEANQTFELYQNISAIGAAKLSGSYSLDGSTIHGSYKTATGSTFWSDAYTVSNLTENGMTWTAAHAAGDVQQFVRVEAVPQEVIDQSTEVRAAMPVSMQGIF